MERIAVFSRYAFEPGEKIHITDGPRKGDWLVMDVSERKVTLKCPVRGTEVHWDRFCYLKGEEERDWPSRLNDA